MQTLTYGLKKPDTGDKGSTFFPALEDNLDLLDAHDHNGTNSKNIPTSSISLVTQSILAAAWVAYGPIGCYRQLVTMPLPLTYDGRIISFKDATTGAPYFLSVEKNSSNTYYVYINDNTISLTAIYV